MLAVGFDWLVWPLGAAATVLLLFIVAFLIFCGWLAKFLDNGK